ncbi:MAG: hypothetical protein J6Y19_03460 [Kiritimatiellae bacterium]|nr:hypothetical protein [Kiritimatiellia bacterium]
MTRHFLRNLFSAVLAAACVFAFSACGGHSRDGHSGNSGNKPAFDVSGKWTTTMDNLHLGDTNFAMKSDGTLSGTLKTDSGETGELSGQLSANDGEYTVTFASRTYLASIVFSSTQTSASGTLIDGDGHVHTLQLTR